MSVSPWKERFYTICHETAERAWCAYMRNVYDEQFLWFHPSIDGKWGRLKSASTNPCEAARNWMIATPECIPRHMTIEQVEDWITHVAERLPLIGD